MKSYERFEIAACHYLPFGLFLAPYWLDYFARHSMRVKCPITTSWLCSDPMILQNLMLLARR